MKQSFKSYLKNNPKLIWVITGSLTSGIWLLFDKDGFYTQIGWLTFTILVWSIFALAVIGSLIDWRK